MPAEVTYLGIRHHGPGSARRVIEALDALQPVEVLVEGPIDLSDQLPFLADDAMVPPVAQLAYPKDAPRTGLLLAICPLFPGISGHPMGASPTTYPSATSTFPWPGDCPSWPMGTIPPTPTQRRHHHPRSPIASSTILSGLWPAPQDTKMAKAGGAM